MIKLPISNLPLAPPSAVSAPAAVSPPPSRRRHSVKNVACAVKNDALYPAGLWGDALAEVGGPLPEFARVHAIQDQQDVFSLISPSGQAAAVSRAHEWYQSQLPPGLAHAVKSVDDAAIARLYQESADPNMVADWVQALSSHDCWSQTYFLGKHRSSFVDRRFSQLVLVPLVLPAEFGPHALSYSRFMPARQWLTQRTHDWIWHRHLLTWMGVAMDFAALCRFGPSSWKSLFVRLRICLGQLKPNEGWPGLLDFNLPADAPRLWFMVGSVVNSKGWLTRVSLDKTQDASVRSDIASGLKFGLDRPVPGIDVGQLALARVSIPAGLSAWLEALHHWHPLQGWTLEPGPQDLVFLHLWFESTQDRPLPGTGESNGFTKQGFAVNSCGNTGRPGWRSTITLRRLHFDRAGWQVLMSTLAQWPHRSDSHSPVIWNLDPAIAGANRPSRAP